MVNFDEFSSMKNWPKEDDEKIDLLVRKKHTLHCACRQVFGDGVCSCNQTGTPRGEQAEKILELIRNELRQI